MYCSAISSVCTLFQKASEHADVNRAVSTHVSAFITVLLYQIGPDSFYSDSTKVLYLFCIHKHEYSLSFHLQKVILETLSKMFDIIPSGMRNQLSKLEGPLVSLVVNPNTELREVLTHITYFSISILPPLFSIEEIVILSPSLPISKHTISHFLSPGCFQNLVLHHQISSPK